MKKARLSGGLSQRDVAIRVGRQRVLKSRNNAALLLHVREQVRVPTSLVWSGW